MVTDLVLLVLLIRPSIYINALSGNSDIAHALNSSLNVGNSARFVRGMILPLSVTLFALGYALLLRVNPKLFASPQKKELCVLLGTGAISGFSFIWSNDYGISCWVCLAVMTFFVNFSRRKKVIKALMAVSIELFFSVLSICAFVEVFTRGNLGAWIKATFGTGRYQSWYYNGGNIYYIYDIDLSYIMLSQAALCIVYLYKLFIKNGKKAALVRYGVPAYANMVGFCAVNEYRLLSRGVSREVALSVLFATVLFEIIHFIVNLSVIEKVEKAISPITLILGTVWCCSTVKEEVVFALTEKEGVYVEALGGNLTWLGEDIINTTNFLDDEKFFATYASAQEVVANTYQPTGTDYIIHALGDEQRENYLNIFKNLNEEDVKYAVTIKGTYSAWEYWVQRANWFFYRQLYENWHPVYSNAYEMYWERNITEGEQNTLTGIWEIETVYENESTVKLIMRTDEIINGTADIFLDYSVQKKDTGTAKLLFQDMLQVQNTGRTYADGFYESNFLRSENAEYIPMNIVGGYGELTLTAQPAQSVYLKLNSVSCDKIYLVGFHYVECSNIVEQGERAVFSIPNTAQNQDIITNAIGLCWKNVNYPIIETFSDDGTIYCTVTGAEKLNYGEDLRTSDNILKVLYEKVSDVYRVCELSDNNWTAGISNDGKTLLFQYDDGLLEKLNLSERITNAALDYQIVEIDTDGTWIRVTVDRDANGCGYPAILTIGGNDDR